MSTNATVKFYDNGWFLVGVVHQHNGYLRGVGNDLLEFLKPIKIINGIGNEVMYNAANGADCLAAQYIAKFKTQIGGLYITGENDIRSYNYGVYIKNNKNIEIFVKKGVKYVFIGTIKEFAEYIKKC